MDKRINKKNLTIALKGGLLIVMSITIANTNITYGYSEYNEKYKNDILQCSSIDNTTYNQVAEINKQESKKIEKIAYITIDDGPSKYTDDILNILNKYNAKGTFFMIDRNMKVYPEKVNRVLEKGNSIGLHSVSHSIDKLYKTNTSAKEEFDKNKETFYNITGQDTKLIRLPYGSKPYTSVEAYNSLVDSGYYIWDWNIDTQDWACTSDEIVKKVKEYSKDRSEVIILLHEKKQTVEALEPILKYLSDEGYKLLPIEQSQTPQNFWLGNLYSK